MIENKNSIEKIVQEKYLIMFQEGSGHCIKLLEKLIRIPFDITPLKEKIEHIYDNLLDLKWLDKEKIRKIQYIKEVTGIQPPEKRLRDAYIEHLKRGDTEILKELNKVGGPQLPKETLEECVQQVYITFLEGGDIKKFKKLLSFTGISPLQETIITAQKRLLEKGEVEKIKKLEELVGGKPQFQEEFIKEIYQKYLKRIEGEEDPISVELDLSKLKKIEDYTGISVEFHKDVLEKAYKCVLESFFDKFFFSSILFSDEEKIKELKKKIKKALYEEKTREKLRRKFSNSLLEWLLSKGDISNKIYQEVYLKGLIDGEIEGVILLQILTGAPLQFKEEDINKIYENLFKKEKVQKVDLLKEMLKKDPPYNLIHETCINYIKKACEEDPSKMIQKANKLKKTFNVKIDFSDLEVVNKIYNFLIDEITNDYLIVKEKYLEALVELKELTGIEPSKEMYKKLEDWIFNFKGVPFNKKLIEL